VCAGIVSAKLSATARKREFVRAIDEVATQSSPTRRCVAQVLRPPRVIEAYAGGVVIRLPRRATGADGRIEASREAVLAMLERRQANVLEIIGH